MKILTSSNNGKYIGGHWEDLEYNDDAKSDSIDEQIQYVNDFADNYIIYTPYSKNYKFELRSDDDLLLYIWDCLPLKGGADLLAYPDHLEVVWDYDGVVYLYPISNEKSAELCNILEDSDFNESFTIEDVIAQYTWNGASVEDVLKSWRY